MLNVEWGIQQLTIHHFFGGLLRNYLGFTIPQFEQ